MLTAYPYGKWKECPTIGVSFRTTRFVLFCFWWLSIVCIEVGLEPRTCFYSVVVCVKVVCEGSMMMTTHHLPLTPNLQWLTNLHAYAFWASKESLFLFSWFLLNFNCMVSTFTKCTCCILCQFHEQLTECTHVVWVGCFVCPWQLSKDCLPFFSKFWTWGIIVFGFFPRLWTLQLLISCPNLEI